MPDVRQELGAMLRAVEQAVARGAGAEEVASLLYEEDAVVLSEGAPGAIRGLEAFKPHLAEVLKGWGGRPRIKFTPLEPILTGDTVATCFLNVSCRPSRPAAVEEHYRLVYSWRKGARGWRVVLEMFSAGTL
jgi:ketosteroid isomerase-like protein